MEENICTWLNSLPAWVRRATEMFIKSGDIKREEIHPLVDICIAEAKGEDCSNIVLKNSSLLEINKGKSFAITEISSVRGVNAINSERPLKFKGNGINVVYGENGTGKSGYIRILKKASGATYSEEIKSNIYSKEKTSPVCNIEIESGGEREILSCDLKNTGQYEVLRQIDVFDTRTAQGYIGDEKEATFEPWIFELFRKLGDTAALIKEELSSKKDSIKINKYNIPAELSNEDRIKKLDEIKYTSKESDYICEFSESDEMELSELRGKSQIEKNNLAITVKNKEIESLEEVLDYFKSFEEFYSEDNLSRIAECGRDWVEKKETLKASKQLLQANVDEIDHLNIDRPVWAELWRIARSLFESTRHREDADFTEVGGICPLCHQTVDRHASKRMIIIDEYVNGRASDEVLKAKKEYEKRLKCPPVKETMEISNRIKGFESELKSLTSANDILRINRNRINEITDEPIVIEFVDVKKAEILIRDVIDTLKERREELRRSNTMAEQKEIQGRILELEAKKFVANHSEQIKENVNSLRAINVLEEAIKKTSTNKITTKGKELAKLLITDAYIERFNSELKKLSGSGLTAHLIQCRGTKGKIPYKVQLHDAEGNAVSPKDILSEGECRAVALAAFFAESSGREEKSPLIVDDPISSLDYEYEKRVITRLVEVAQYRQVIVFTHRISVVVGIGEQCSAKGNVSYEELKLNSISGKKGIPSNGVKSTRIDSFLNSLINDNIAKLRKMEEGDETFNRERHYICQQFRNCVEKSVEKWLIGGVVERFRKDVQTMRIKYLQTITKQDCDLIETMMTKYSQYDHSMSDETPLIEFPVEEIENDMRKFLEWVKDRKNIIN